MLRRIVWKAQRVLVGSECRSGITATVLSAALWATYSTVSETADFLRDPGVLILATNGVLLALVLAFIGSVTFPGHAIVGLFAGTVGAAFSVAFPTSDIQFGVVRYATYQAGTFAIGYVLVLVMFIYWPGIMDHWNSRNKNQPDAEVGAPEVKGPQT